MSELKPVQWVRKAYRKWLRAGEIAQIRRANVGKDTKIDNTVQVYGWNNVIIGRSSIICEDVLLNAVNNPSGSKLSIGNYCFIGRRTYISTGDSVSIGDYCMMGQDCVIVSADHDYQNPFSPYITAGSTCGTIKLGPNCWLGAKATVLNNVEVGYGSIIGAMSVVTSSIPPLSLAVGNPARVIKRYCSSEKKWMPIIAANAIDCPSEDEYLQQLNTMNERPRMPWGAIGKSVGDSI